MDAEQPSSLEQNAVDSPYVFLSYSSLDLDFALRLGAGLRDDGVHVWMDRLVTGIQPGSSWQASLDGALKNSSALIAILSPEYLQSTYCLAELQFAFGKKLLIYPVLLRKVSDHDKPFWLDSLQFTDFSSLRDPVAYENSLARLVRAIRAAEPNQMRAVPDPEGQYLNRLMAELRGKRGVAKYFPLTAQAQPQRPLAPSEDEFGFGQLRRGRNAITTENEGVPAAPISDVEEIIERFARCVILGDPGAGKTTTLRRLALIAAQRRQQEGRRGPLPMILYLGDWQKGEPLTAFVDRHWPFSSDPGSLLAGGDVLVFLDGLNEMGGHTEENVKEIKNWLTSARGPARIVMTCRSSDYRKPLEFEDLPCVTLLSLHEDEIRAYTSVYLTEKADDFTHKLEDRKLATLARNPYFLSALVYLYEQSGLKDMPTNRGLLFRRLTMAVWQRERLRQTAGWQPYEEMIGQLGTLARMMFTRQSGATVGQELACEVVGSALMDAAIHASLLERRGATLLFTHSMMQEFFTATWLVAEDTRQRCRQFLAETTPHHGGQHPYWNDKIWNPLRSEQIGVLLALLGIAPKFDEAVDFLLKDHPDVVAQCAIEGDDELGFPRALLDRVESALVARAKRSSEDALAYGMSSYDGDPEQLMAIYQAEDAERYYRNRTDEFGAWLRKGRVAKRSRSPHPKS